MRSSSAASAAETPVGSEEDRDVEDAAAAASSVVVIVVQCTRGDQLVGQFAPARANVRQANVEVNLERTFAYTRHTTSELARTQRGLDSVYYRSNMQNKIKLEMHGKA